MNKTESKLGNQSSFTGTLLDTLTATNVKHYTCKLPCGLGEIVYRPYLVKEEKILLLAFEESKNVENEKEKNRIITDAILQVLNQCTIKSPIKIEDLPTFAFEYYFVQIRCKSAGNTTPLKFRLKQCPLNNNEPCKEPPIKQEIDLTEAKIVEHPGWSNKIILDKSKNLGIIMRYPTVKMTREIDDTEGTDGKFELVQKCIEMIFMGDDCWKGDDIPDEQKKAFIENLSSDQFMKIINFFEKMPSLQQEITVRCPKCKKTEKVLLKGLANFFA